MSSAVLDNAGNEDVADDWENDTDTAIHLVEEKMKQVKLLKRSEDERKALSEEARKAAEAAAAQKKADDERREAMGIPENSPSTAEMQMFAGPQIKLLRRPNSGTNIQGQGGKTSPSEEKKPPKSLEERQAAYDAARSRILGDNYKPEPATTTPAPAAPSRSKSPEQITISRFAASNMMSGGAFVVPGGVPCPMPPNAFQVGNPNQQNVRSSPPLGNPAVQSMNCVPPPHFYPMGFYPCTVDSASAGETSLTGSAFPGQGQGPTGTPSPTEMLASGHQSRLMQSSAVYYHSTTGPMHNPPMPPHTMGVMPQPIPGFGPSAFATMPQMHPNSAFMPNYGVRSLTPPQEYTTVPTEYYANQMSAQPVVFFDASRPPPGMCGPMPNHQQRQGQHMMGPPGGQGPSYPVPTTTQGGGMFYNASTHSQAPPPPIMGMGAPQPMLYSEGLISNLMSGNQQPQQNSQQQQQKHSKKKGKKKH